MSTNKTWDALAYAGPVGEGPAGWSVQVVEADPLNKVQYALQGRPSGDGPFHVLRHHGQLWMSDTDAEKRDHLWPVYKIRVVESPLVLIHGLGLGLVVAAALRFGSSVDVVELDADLIGWMEPWLQELAAEHGGVLRVHHDNAMTRKWPPGMKWDVVWHDIWPELSEDNLPDMHKLHRSFGRRAGWQGSWGRDFLERQRRSRGWW